MNPALSLLIQSIQQVIFIDEKAFLESQQQSPITAVKLNSNKITDIKNIEFETDDKIKWADDAYYLTNRPAFYLDPLFYAGAYYVMDASSMFLEYILKYLNIDKNSVVLDIAAAPGGKSVLLSNYLNDDGLVWSNEINSNRAKVLNYNLSKWGKNNFTVTNHSTDEFIRLENIFDVVICDAPCTGSGLFRKYPEWMSSFNEKYIQQCVQRQKQILKHLFPCVKENAYLIYSTCSFTVEENENISEYIIQNGFEYVPIQIPHHYGIVNTYLGIRFFPHLTPSEGFFYATFQKKVTHTSSQNKTETKKYSKELKAHALKPQELHKVPFLNFVNIRPHHRIYQQKDKYYLSNRVFDHFTHYPFRYISIGTLIAYSGAHAPSAELALSVYLNENVPKHYFDKNTTLKFLKKENLNIHSAKGIHLVMYNGLGLGWAKVLENRTNNYFPTEWRILKDIANE